MTNFHENATMRFGLIEKLDICFEMKCVSFVSALVASWLLIWNKLKCGSLGPSSASSVGPRLVPMLLSSPFLYENLLFVSHYLFLVKNKILFLFFILLFGLIVDLIPSLHFFFI